MRVDQAKVNVQRSGKFEETQFKIKASSKAFDILSSKLYSDPQLAIIRELSTNAWDAHVEAGNEDKPFEVHLPNRMEAYFFIRDYGTGMSHQNIMQLYTTYFESTKTNTNEQVGCLGLGSKSPFSYTDNFSVISWFRGKKRVYSMFKGEEGFPKVALMQTLDSDEPSGIEVRFACKTEDVSDFVDKAKKVYRKFPVLPNFHGSSTFSIEEREVALKGRGWKIYEGARGGPHPSYAIMGCIGYPLHAYHLKGDAQLLLRNASIDVEFPIGSLEIAANREELQYSDFTKEAVEKVFNTICDDIADKLSEKFDRCKSLWEARCLYQQLFGTWSSTFQYLDSTVGQRIRWKGKLVGPHNRKTQDWAVDEFADVIEYKLAQNRRYDYIVRRSNDVSHISPQPKTHLLIDDLDILSGGRIGAWMKANRSTVDRVYVVSLHKWDREHEEKLHETLGTNAGDFRTTSSIPRPPKNPKGTISTPKPKAKVIPIEARGFTFKEGKYDYPYGHVPAAWREEVIDVMQPGVYVAWRKHEVVAPRGTCSARTLQEILSCLDVMGRKPQTVYAFKAGYVQRALDKQPDWIDLFTYAKRELKKFIIGEKLSPLIRAKKGADKVKDFEKYKKVAAHLETESPLKDFVDKVLGAKKTQQKVDSAITLANLLGEELGEGSIEADVKVIEMRYPMLKWVRDSYYYDRDSKRQWKDAARYVELVDRSKEV